MPLVIMVGLPGSGKTRRAMELKSAMETAIAALNENAESKVRYQPQVVVVNEESLKINRAESYLNANEEKKVRGALLSAVERYLAKDVVVILDSMNYIKGFRYQLHCVAKSLNTSQCTLYCMATPEDTIKWNSSRPSDQAYPPEIHSSLLTRLEEPDSRNRWDNPLYSVLSTDPLPDQLIPTLLEPSARLTPNQSVAMKPLAETNYLHEMDAKVKAVADCVMSFVRDGGGGGMVKVPGTDVQVVVPSRGISVSEMGRLRRMYAAGLNRLETRIDLNLVATGLLARIG
ncbi:kti12, chromatin associated, partial [Blyttiomyces sp. JEL0837]